jgi:hypothetical protein
MPVWQRCARLFILTTIALTLVACGGSEHDDLTPESLEAEYADWAQMFRAVDHGEREPFGVVDMALSLGMQHRRALLYYELQNNDTELLIPVDSRGLRVVADDVDFGECDALIADIASRFDCELYNTYYRESTRRQFYLLDPPGLRDNRLMARIGEWVLGQHPDKFAVVLYYVAYYGSHGEGGGGGV